MPNRLSQESSPYLRQHAGNPVAWEPWGPEAFERARRENKPVFLSIGYATCHWCHVMAHESFEDEEVGRLLNEDFVSIKLDREERPDVDKVYMTYVQSMTGRGGWPLNVFLSPELKPFFGGTYYPPEDRQGHPGFKTVVRAIAHAWRTDPGQLLGEGERVVQALGDHFSATTRSEAAPGEGAGWLEKTWPAAYAYFNEAFDPNLGGFGGAPKFPQPGNLQFLLRYAAGTDDAQERTEARRMVTQTLGRMSCGGIHDHVGGGYHRYSVDEYWFVPHFEKMLYDQAQLCCAALSTWQATHDERFAWIARDILQYALRDLGRPGGGFYAAEDADSPVSAEPGAACREGAFYLWAAAELREVLGEAYTLFAEHFGVKAEGNVPEHLDPHGDFTGLNHLAQQRPLADTAAKLGLAVPEAGRRLAEGLERLRLLRERRPRPLRDEKIVCAWNGMMISALARASACPSPVLRGAWEAFGGRSGAELCLEAARSTARFLLKELWDEASGTLLRSWCGGIPGPRAVSEDYACLVKGLIDLYEADFDPEWLRVAERLQDDMLLRFHDDEGGGFYNSEAGAADLILRLKEDYDGAEPAPSSLAVSNLLRLAAMLGRGEYRTQALAALEAFRPHWEKFPQAMPVMLTSLELALLFPPQKVLLTGDVSGEAGRALLDVLWEDSGRPRVLLGLPAGGDHAWLRSRNAWLAGLGGEGVATVRLCTQEACLPPVVDPGAFREQLWRI